MPPKKDTKASSNVSKNAKQSQDTPINRKRKVSELETPVNKQTKPNQSVFKILSSKMKGGKQTCSKYLQEKCQDVGCTDPHYTIVNVMEDNQFKNSIKKHNGCNDAMNKILGDQNQDAIIMEVIMKKVDKDELKKILTNPKDHLYYSMGVQGASSKQLTAIRNLRNAIQGNQSLKKNFHSSEDSDKNELLDKAKELITDNHIFKCQFESNTTSRNRMDIEVADKLSKEDMLKIIDERMIAQNEKNLSEIKKIQKKLLRATTVIRDTR